MTSSWIRLPEQGAVEQTVEIMEIDPGAKVITFSGRASAAVHNETAEILGAVASFRKPFGLGKVVKAIREALADRRGLAG